MRWKSTRKAVVAVMAAVALAGPAPAAGSSAPGAVYTQTNDPAGNAVVAFARNADGSLTAAGS